LCAQCQLISEGGSAGTSVRGPESQEGTFESPKGLISLAIDVLFSFFHWYFQLLLAYLENLLCNIHLDF